MSLLLQKCVETEKNKGKEKGCGVRSVDVNRYTKQIPDLSLYDGAFQTQLPTAEERLQIVQRSVLFEPADSEREAEEVDGV